MAKQSVVPAFGCEHKKLESDICCCKDVPMVKQEFKEDCDINKIIERCLRNGVPLPVYEHIAPVYADVSEMGDYREMLGRLDAAQAAFNELPAKTRARFDNDPAKLMDFIQDPKNLDEGRELGIFAPSAPVEGDVSETGGQVVRQSAKAARKPEPAKPEPKAKEVSDGE